MEPDVERAIPGDYQWRALNRGWRYQRAWHRARLALVRQVCPPAPGSRALDAASGSGVLAHSLADSGARVYNMDMRVSACSVALRRGDSAGAVAGLLSELPFASGAFEVVYLLEVIEHLPEGQAGAILEDLRRVTAKGGRLFVTTPNYASAWPLLERLVDASRLAPKMHGAQHVARYDRQSLERLLSRTGWTLLETGTFNLFAPVGGLVSRGCAERLLRFEARRLRSAGLLLYAVARCP